MKKIFSSFIYIALFLTPIVAWAVTCDDSSLDGKSDQELQAIYDQCTADAAALQVSLTNTQKQSNTLKTGIAAITTNINKTQLDIKAKTTKIKQLGASVVVKT